MKSIHHLIGMTVGIAGVSLPLSTRPGNASAQTAKVDINAAEMHQTIDGFGGAQPGGDPNQVPVQDRATMFVDPQGAAFPYRSQIMDLLFSAEKGIGLTILRMKVNAMLEPSLGVWNDQDPAQARIMQEAVKRGPVKLIASVWSPPAWMKTSGHTVGGSLGLEHHQHFADLLTHYVTQYANTNGVNIYAVSMTNEPDTDKSLTEMDPWDTCTWTSEGTRIGKSESFRPDHYRFQ
jgi:glucuronoarabinoxylan endo-1,4-beta-xylanase